MKVGSNHLLAYSYRPEAYQRIIPEVTWMDRVSGINNVGLIVEELRRSSTDFCLCGIRLRDFPLHIRNRSLLCLDEYFSEKELKRYFPLALDLCRSDGKLMAIPEDFSPYVLFLRNDLMKQYGLRPPQDLLELRQQLVLLKKKTGNGCFHMGVGGIYMRLGFLTSVLGSFGVDLNQSLEKWAETADAMVEAYEWIRSLHQQGLMVGLDSFVRQLNPLPTVRKVERFKSEYVFIPHWLGSLHKTLEPEWYNRLEPVLFPPASLKIKPCRPFAGHCWIIPANTQDPVTAIKVLKKTQDLALVKENEMEGGFPFIARHELWKDRDLIKKHRFFHWIPMLRGVENVCLVSTFLRKFELLDESFRLSIRDNLDGKAWLRTLLTHEFGASRKIVSDGVIKRAVAYMEKNMNKLLTAQQVAEHLKISPNYFSQIFQKTMKMGYGAYLRKIRMERAQELLRDRKMSIKAIATELGFKHPQTFTRAFREYTGKSPSELSREK